MKSSTDTDEIPDFSKEVGRAIKRINRPKAHRMDGIPPNNIKLGRPSVLTYLKNISNNILMTNQISDSWHETKIVILFKKGDPKDIKNCWPISLLSHNHKTYFYKILANDNRKKHRMKTNRENKQVSKKLFYTRPPASSKLSHRKVT